VPALVEELVKQVGNRRVPAGSIILVFSAAHLGNVGLTAYVADHLAAAKKIRDNFSKETKVGPLPPLIGGGCKDPSLIRAIFEFAGWARSYYRQSFEFLDDSYELALRRLRSLGEGEQKNLEWWRYRLPA
jgi:hypothetical protein